MRLLTLCFIFEAALASDFTRMLAQEMVNPGLIIERYIISINFFIKKEKKMEKHNTSSDKLERCQSISGRRVYE